MKGETLMLLVGGLLIGSGIGSQNVGLVIVGVVCMVIGLRKS